MRLKKGELDSRSKYVIRMMIDKRKQCGFYQEDVAALLSCSVSKVGKTEAFLLKYLDLDYVFAFCDVLNIDIRELLPPPGSSKQDIEKLLQDYQRAKEMSLLEYRKSREINAS